MLLVRARSRSRRKKKKERSGEEGAGEKKRGIYTSSTVEWWLWETPYDGMQCNDRVGDEFQLSDVVLIMCACAPGDQLAGDSRSNACKIGLAGAVTGPNDPAKIAGNLAEGHGPEARRGATEGTKHVFKKPQRAREGHQQAHEGQQPKARLGPPGGHQICLRGGPGGRAKATRRAEPEVQPGAPEGTKYAFEISPNGVRRPPGGSRGPTAGGVTRAPRRAPGIPLGRP